MTTASTLLQANLNRVFNERDASRRAQAIQDWDTLQFVGEPKNSAPMLGPNIPRANPNGMF